MIQKLFAMSGHLEILARYLLAKNPKIKELVKSRFKRSGNGIKKDYDEDKWNEYAEAVSAHVNNGEIVLIHSSMDGLNEMGVSTEKVLKLLLTFVDRDCTVVLPSYAIGSAKINDGKLKLYDPRKSPCWTGMLPNLFIRTPGVIRTVYPYNSLAAIGPHTKPMMEDNEKQVYVYGDHSAWKYCVEHHAKILFIGTTSDDSNTIQTHMIADVMKDDWPIQDWYQTVFCPVRINNEVVEKKIFVQKEYWSRFVADYHITRKLKQAHILEEHVINGCPFGCVQDSKEMVDYLVSLANNGDTSYIVPRRCRRKDNKNEH